MKKLFWIGLAVSVCSYGGSITLTGGSTPITFAGDTISYSGTLAGTFGVPFGMLSIPVSWSVANTTFTYDPSTGIISDGNPVAFTLSGLDVTVSGSASFSQAVNGPSNTAALLGIVTVSSNVNGGMIAGDTFLETVLSASAGGPIVPGERFGISVNITGCTPGACIELSDPTGTASSVTLSTLAPEPASYALMGGGLVALGLLKRRYDRRSA